MLAAAKVVLHHLPRGHPVPVEIMVSSPWRRWLIKRHLHSAVQRLRRVLPASLTLDSAVVVQTVIVAERQLPGCYQMSQHPDGSRFALIRLALQVDGHHLTTDEILAVLAEQYIALTMQAAPSLLVPIDLGSSSRSDPPHHVGLHRDPLTGRTDTVDRIA